MIIANNRDITQAYHTASQSSHVSGDQFSAIFTLQGVIWFINMNGIDGVNPEGTNLQTVIQLIKCILQHSCGSSLVWDCEGYNVLGNLAQLSMMYVCWCDCCFSPCVYLGCARFPEILQNFSEQHIWGVCAW